MKRVWQHPQEPETGKRYWRSLEEFEGSARFRDWLDREFPQGAAEMSGRDEADESRRSFLKLMGAATSLAGFGMAACRRPEAFLVPYSESVEWIVPGKPLLYATAMPRLGGCTPLVVTTHEGRPTHVTGNRLHPDNGNGLDAFAQQSILDLYDPERSKQPLREGAPVTHEEFDAAFQAVHAGIVGSKGEGVGLLVGEDTSPTRARLLGELVDKLPGIRVFRYESIHRDEVRAANAAAFGAGKEQVPRVAKARRLVTLDCDFLNLDRVLTNGVREFVAGRKADELGPDEMNRLYAVEANYTLTGGMADHRLRLNLGQMAAVAARLAEKVGASAAAGAFRGDAIDDPAVVEWIDAVAEDLLAHKGEALVLAGTAQPAAVHLLVAAINEALEAFGATLDVVDSGDRTEYGSLADLVDAIGAKRITRLFVTTEADPAYDAPVDLNWSAAQKSLETVIHLGVRSLCATARLATWHIPGAHYLERWGDVRSAEGTYSVVQPMIEPLYGGWSEIDLLLRLLEDPAAPEAAPEPAGDAAAAAAPAAAPVAAAPSPAYLAVKETFSAIADGDVETAWNHALRDGFVAGSAFPATTSRPDATAVASGVGAFIPPAAPGLEAMEVHFRPDSKVWDGRYINNGWAQEAPDPITKLTWDNAAQVSIRTARDLGIRRDGQLVKVEVGGRAAYFPVVQAPGHADDAVTLPLGYGQSEAGRVGDGTGFNANPLRTAKAPFLASGAKVTAVTAPVEVDGRTIPVHHELATTAEHQNMYNRAVVREGSVERLAEDPAFASREGMDAHIPENISLYKPTDKDGNPLRLSDDGTVYINDEYHQWAMVIDLNQCIGCTACLVACQSENNIPIVGKEQVLRHREMHWIRMDRYFATPDPKKDMKTQVTDSTNAWTEMAAEHFANPEMIVQPVACQQCELAPCETVCPVNATVHNEEGLNVMAYNRCIGTRYCANNCPYKARRFNFFDYNKRPIDELYRGPLSSPEKTGLRESLKLQKNPNVSVRMRGVMEKCTYCVQRIEEGKIRQKQVARDSSRKRVPANSVRTACQDACPAEAIAFGNVLDEHDHVHARKASPRNYDMLAYVGARPRTSYLARIKNPNPAIEKITGMPVGEISRHIH